MLPVRENHSFRFLDFFRLHISHVFFSFFEKVKYPLSPILGPSRMDAKHSEGDNTAHRKREEHRAVSHYRVVFLLQVGKPARYSWQ